MVRETDVAIIGAGSAGLYAMAQVTRAGRDFVLINGGPLGTTCARVGCMPSKVAIQVGEDRHAEDRFPAEGIRPGSGHGVDRAAALARVRALRDGFVGKLLERVVPRLGDRLIEGYARFHGPGKIEVDNGTVIRARSVVVAVGSRPVVPGSWRESFGDRLLTTDSLFEQETLPDRMAVLGLGAIGLELGQALHRWGVAMTGVDMLNTVAGLSDPEVARSAIQTLSAEFPLWLGTAAELAEGRNGALRVSAGEEATEVDKVLVCLGRQPNTESLNLEALGVDLDDKGMPPVDPATGRVGALPVFFAGDVTGTRAVLHEAGDEGRIAGHNAARWPETPHAFRRKTPLGIVFCDPNVAQVGAPWSDLADNPDVAVGSFAVANQSRARVMGRNLGLMRVYGDRRDGRLLGAALCSPRAEHLAHQLAWAMEAGLTVFDLARMPVYHPVLEEGLHNAILDLAGQCEGGPEHPLELQRLD